jgi:hypothetical protein
LLGTFKVAAEGQALKMLAAAEIMTQTDNSKRMENVFFGVRVGAGFRLKYSFICL